MRITPIKSIACFSLHPRFRFPTSSMVKMLPGLDRRLFRLRVKQYPFTQRTSEKAESSTYAHWPRSAASLFLVVS
jgi:hypothetical protein